MAPRMATTLFVSDLHLSRERPGKVRLFRQFLSATAARVEALYVLGDLFEYWLGDDDDAPPHEEIVEALRAFADAGPALYFMRGNRDFLIGERFAHRTGCRLLADPTVIDLYGRRTLVMHGDLLCTRDHAYQSLRKMVNDPGWQTQVLSKPLSERRLLAENMRSGSRAHTAAQEEFIMDVEHGTVERYLRDHGVRELIHGHTHRPRIHEFDIDGRAARRIVLGDWYAGDSVLVAEPAGERLERVGTLVNRLA